jgi:GT2 family glycosyltransferase
MSPPLVSVVIPSWNGAHLLPTCLDSLRAQRYARLEVVVADGNSTDGTAELLDRRYPEVRLLRLPANFGFSGNVNAGLRAARGELFALLNNDAAAEPDWVAALVAALEAAPRAGSLASKLLHFDARQTIASAGDLLRRSGLAAQRGNGQPDDGRFERLESVFSASGGAALYRRALLADVGLLDEGYGSYLEDLDLGLRARLRGWDCLFVPGARVYHRVSATGGGRLASYLVARNTLRLVARGFPDQILRRCWPAVLGGQLRVVRSALQAWRGAEARATLRGVLAGLRDLPAALRSRPPIQARRLLSDAAFFELLTPDR